MTKTDVSPDHQAYLMFRLVVRKTLVHSDIGNEYAHTEHSVLSLSRGPCGVGINELRRRLLISDPDHYGVTVPRKTDI